MMVRELKPEEFSLLRSLPDAIVPDPRTSVAVIAEEAGEVIGRLLLVAPAHLECPWVREDRRGSMAFRQMVEAAEAKAKNLGVKRLFAYGANPEMEDYIRRLGYQLQPLTVWSKEL